MIFLFISCSLSGRFSTCDSSFDLMPSDGVCCCESCRSADVGVDAADGVDDIAVETGRAGEVRPMPTEEEVEEAGDTASDAAAALDSDISIRPHEGDGADRSYKPITWMD
jgi:hypothetical protein